MRLTLSSGEEAAAAASARGDVIVLIDALRATTTIITALAEGVREVMPVATVEECTGELTAGERKGAKLPGMDLDNSPRSFLNRAHAEKRLTLTTTNGTRCLKAAAANPDAVVLIAAMVNLNAVTSAAAHITEYYGKDLSIIPSGRLHEEAVEDNLTAELIKKAIESGRPVPKTPESEAAHLRIFMEGSSGLNLISLGLKYDIPFCAQQDLYETVPVFQNGVCRPLCNDEPPLRWLK